jgi:hypothetical protein
MNETLVNWTTALRSDKYKQGGGRLKSTDGSFCVLGVLCDTIDPKGWGDVEADYVTYLGPDSDGDLAQYEFFPPSAYLRMLGLPKRMNCTPLDVTIPISLLNESQKQKLFKTFTTPCNPVQIRGECDLSHLNDAKIPFEELADLIEKAYGYHSSLEGEQDV